MMSLDLKGKIALITGSTKGIGKTIALKFSKNGADVIINGRSEENGMKTVDSIKDMGRQAIFEKADVTVYAQVKEMVDRILKKIPKIDILVASGGVVSSGKVMTAPSFFKEIDPSTYIDFFNSQYFSRLYCIRAVLDHMVERKSGKIILISTDAGRWPTPGESLPGGAGAALVMSTKVLAGEFARWGIRINTISTTVTRDTPGIEHVGSYGTVGKIFQRAMQRQPFPITSNDIAQTALFLASQESDQITGQIISVNGGLCFPG
ncbi:MAG: SDR family oxidoreductase [Thermodesulfobacteriota bacterium]|nr:SDR family oxidoreductase [Thermodesulfobacteriota bacterium]